MCFNKEIFATAIACVLVALCTVGPALAQRQSLPQSLQAYLLQDCGSGDEDPEASLKAVLSYGREAVPFLLTAVRQGPSVAEQDTLTRRAEAGFRRSQEFIQQGGLSGLEDDEVRRDAEALDQDTYVDMLLRSFVLGYQERALNALGALKYPSVLDSLRVIAAQPGLTADLRRAINEIIEQ